MSDIVRVNRPYPPDSLDAYKEDNGTMPNNVADLESHLIGRKIVRAERRMCKAVDFKAGARMTYDHGHDFEAMVLTLDDGTEVALEDTDDCCAYTSLEGFFLNPAAVDHMITGVQTTEGYTKWHIYADFGDIMGLNVSWSSGNPFYYGYGFDIFVSDNVIEGEVVEPTPRIGESRRRLEDNKLRELEGPDA